MQFDRWLSWREHIRAQASKANRMLGAVRKLIAGLHGGGAPARVMLLLYKALVRSLMEYGCPLLLCAPPSVLRPLEQVQRRALRAACGAPISVSDDSLCADLAVPPLPLRFAVLLLRLEARTLRLVPTHLLRLRWLSNVRPRLVAQGGPSMASYNQRLGGSLVQRLATVHADLAVPYESPAAAEPLAAAVDGPVAGVLLSKCPHARDDKAAAAAWTTAQVSAALAGPGPVQVMFVDGACTADGGGGAAFSVLRPGDAAAVVEASYLSDRECSDSAELLSLCVGVHAYWVRSVAPAGSPPGALHVFADSELSLSWAVDGGKLVRFATLRNETARLLRAIIAAGHSIHAYWAPGHCGFRLMEEVDRAAKMASKSRAAPSVLAARCLPFAPASYREACRSFARAGSARWASLWASAAGHGHLRAIKPSPASAPSCWSGPRVRDTALMLLRHGHCLNAHLHGLGRAASAVCPHVGCGVEESVEHFLLHCPAYAVQRRVLSESVSAIAGPDIAAELSLQLLLGSGAPLALRAAIGDAVALFVQESRRVLLEPLLRSHRAGAPAVAGPGVLAVP
jgi:ribonuclease HI